MMPSYALHAMAALVTLAVYDMYFPDVTESDGFGFSSVLHYNRSFRRSN